MSHNQTQTPDQYAILPAGCILGFILICLGFYNKYCDPTPVEYIIPDIFKDLSPITDLPLFPNGRDFFKDLFPTTDLPQLPNYWDIFRDHN
jgi:hypothetical protein